MNSYQVSPEKFGDAWPLTVASGKLACYYSADGEVIFFIAPDGQEYYLKGGPLPSGNNALPIYPINKRDPKNLRAFMPTDVLIKEGRRLCRS